MGRTTIVQLIDDLDGSDATTTVQFGWDGVNYQIDLTTAHAKAFTTAIQPYLAVARRTSPPRRGQRTQARRTPSPVRRGSAGAADPAAIRTWAADNGLSVAARGRIPASVVDAYQAARRAAPAPGSPGDPAPAVSPATRARKAPATRAAAKKPAAKKAPAKKAARKAAAKKTAAKKTAAKRSPRTAASKSVASKRGGARKRPATRAGSSTSRS